MKKLIFIDQTDQLTLWILNRVLFLLLIYTCGCDDPKPEKRSKTLNTDEKSGSINLVVKPVKMSEWECKRGFFYQADITHKGWVSIDSVIVLRDNDTLTYPHLFGFKVPCENLSNFRTKYVPITAYVFYDDRLDPLVLSDTVIVPPLKPWDSWKAPKPMNLDEPLDCELQVKPYSEFENWTCEDGFSYRGVVDCNGARVDSIRSGVVDQKIEFNDSLFTMTFVYGCPDYDLADRKFVFESRIYRDTLEPVILYDTISIPPPKPWDVWENSTNNE